MRRLVIASAFVSFFFAMPVLAQQFDASAFSGSLSISLSPQYPQPGQVVRLSVTSGSLDLENSAIVWRAKGKVVAQGTGVTSAEVPAGILGSETSVGVDIDTPDGAVLSTQATIAPTELEMLVGSDSYVPPFYLGRALPSAGTNIILQAVAHFKRTDGTSIPDSSIVYTWKRNNEVIASASGRGKSSALLPMQHLFTKDVIAVDAISSDKSRSGSVSVLVPSIEPTLDLYQDHPLYGTLYHRALLSSTFISESEMTFTAVPYFAQTSSPASRFLAYDWRVNNIHITPSASAPNEITINAQNSSGQANIALEVTHTTNFYFDAKGEWGVVLSSRAASSDAFHSTVQ